MFWRLPAPVRSLYVSNCRSYSSKAGNTAGKTADPLRILFCGSDDFSIASLRKLSEAQQAEPGLIESINVLHRPAKRTGRGLKKIREVPIQAVATNELKLQTHVIDTFTGWTPPISYNLIIAVSFGLFVPPRILNLAKYQGLNVHPSLLPDLAGAAPLHHTILKRRSVTGVTVQTLHPKRFDGGLILAQTPKPGLLFDPHQVPLRELTMILGHEGGNMLVDVLKTRAFVPPLEDVGWYARSGGPVEHAKKLEKGDWYVDLSKATRDDIIAMEDAGGTPWTTLRNGKRLLLNRCRPSSFVPTDKVTPGIWCPNPQHPSAVGEAWPRSSLMAITADGRLLEIESSTLEGGKKGGGYDAFKTMFGTKHIDIRPQN